MSGLAALLCVCVCVCCTCVCVTFCWLAAVQVRLFRGRRQQWPRWPRRRPVFLHVQVPGGVHRAHARPSAEVLDQRRHRPQPHLAHHRAGADAAHHRHHQLLAARAAPRRGAAAVDSRRRLRGVSGGHVWAWRRSVCGGVRPRVHGGKLCSRKPHPRPVRVCAGGGAAPVVAVANRRLGVGGGAGGWRRCGGPVAENVVVFAAARGGLNQLAWLHPGPRRRP